VQGVFSFPPPRFPFLNKQRKHSLHVSETLFSSLPFHYLASSAHRDYPLLSAHTPLATPPRLLFSYCPLLTLSLTLSLARVFPPSPSISPRFSLSSLFTSFALQALRFIRMLKLIRAVRFVSKLNKLKQHVRVCLFGVCVCVCVCVCLYK
jgi:hypothetical protein